MSGWTCAGPSAPPTAPAATRPGWCAAGGGREPRRLILLCDVSGSMEPYTRVFLTLLQAAVAGARAEAFVFATRLTRLTRQLAVRDPDQALARAAAASAGLGRGHPAGRRASPGSSPTTAAGGWPAARSSWCCPTAGPQDDPDDVREAMARLRRLAHRIVWVNPRRAAPGYAPLVGGMAAALPFCDAFVSGHSLAALEEVAAAVRDDRLTVSVRMACMGAPVGRGRQGPGSQPIVF